MSRKNVEILRRSNAFDGTLRQPFSHHPPVGRAPAYALSFALPLIKLDGYDSPRHTAMTSNDCLVRNAG
jgi:hypothetical protein